MTWPDWEDSAAIAGGASHNEHSRGGRILLSRDLVDGRYDKGERLLLPKITKEYDLDCTSALRVLADLQALGMIKISGVNSVLVRSSRPKEMYEAYAIRAAALEEIAGRPAVGLLKGNTALRQRAVDTMRAAVRNHDLDAYTEQDVIFHRSILEASANNVLLRVWDSLAFDIRIRAAIGRVVGDLPEIVESHQPIVDALEQGQGKEAGLLLRNHVETFLQFLRKEEMDSAFFDQDLDIARDGQKAFIPQAAPSIPGLSCEIFYKPAHRIGGDYYDFFPLRSGLWGIAIGDVSGKGIGAALIMASLQASVRAQALQLHSDPSALINQVNRLVHESSPVQFYASLFYREYDPAARVLTYVNAGRIRRSWFAARRAEAGYSGYGREVRRSDCSPTRATTQFASIWRTETSWWRARTESSMRKTATANFGGNGVSRACFSRVGGNRPGRFLTESYVKCRHSRMAHLKRTI